MLEKLEKIKVTNNEYNEIIKKEVDDVYKCLFKLDLQGEALEKGRKEIWDEYYKKIDCYEILPFEINTTNELLKETINKYCNEENIQEKKVVYKGYCPITSISYKIKDLLECDYIYLDAYQTCLCNDKLRLFFEYTEGDICFSILNTEKDYLDEMEKIIKFNENK